MEDKILYLSGIPENICLKYINYDGYILKNNELNVPPHNNNVRLIYLFPINNYSKYYRIQSIFSFFFKYILNNCYKNITVCFVRYKNAIIPQDCVSNKVLKDIFKIDIYDEKYYLYMCHKNMLIYITTNNFIIFKKIRYSLKLLLLDINTIKNINDTIYNLYLNIIKTYITDIIKLKRIDLY